MWEPLQRYSALPPAARRMFRRAVFRLSLVRGSLRLRGYKKTQQWLQKKLDDRPSPAPQLQDVNSQLEMTCRMVRAAERYSPGQASCLEESLLLWYLLQSQHISVSIRIGVRKQGERFEAHAWVEKDGVALNQHEEQHRHYSPFDGNLQPPPEERA